MNECKDSWTGKDKVKHFCVCLVLASICPIVAVVVAVAKEVSDEKTEGNHWCWKDIVADVAGIALGTAVMAVSYLANSAGVYGETMHAVVHYVGMFLAPMGMLYVASYLFKFCWYHRIFIHYLMAKELVNITDWYVGIPITDEEMAELHMWITGVFLAIAITTYIYRRWKERKI